MKYLVDIDFNKNQALNMVLQVLPAAPASPAIGQTYYNSVDKTVYSYNSTGWLDLGYAHPNVAGGAKSVTASGATVIATFTTDARGHVTAITTRAMTLADLGYTGATDANKYVHPVYSSTPYSRGGALKVISGITITGGHITGITETDLSADSLGELIINDGSTTATKRTWSADALNKKFLALDNTIAGALVYKGGYAAGTNLPNLTAPVAGAVVQGYTYTVTTAGTFLGEKVDPGDMLIAEKTDPTLREDWTIVNKNIEELLYATEAVAGKIEIATQAEVNAKTDATRAVTPKTLSVIMASAEAGTVFKAHIGNGTATSFDLIHGLGTKDVMVQVYDDLGASPTFGEEVGVIKKRLSTSSVRIQLNTAIATNELRVLVKKI